MQRELHQKVENPFKVFYFERIHQKRLLVRERACSRCQLQRWFVSSVSFSLGGSSLKERESEREREVQRKALTLSAQTQTWRLPPPTTSDESVAKK